MNRIQSTKRIKAMRQIKAIKHLAALLGVLLALSAPAFAQVAPAPPLMNFQGRLTKANGTPVPDGTYSVTFSLYDALTGGSLVWTETDSVTARNGAFAALLGSATPLSSATFAGNVWLQIAVGTAPPLAPRQQIVTVASAFKANSVRDGGVTTGSLADGAVTFVKIADGAVTTSKIASGAVGLGQLSAGLQSTVSKFSAPFGPTLVGSVATTAPVSIATEGNYAYVLSGSALQIFDIRVPQTPVLTGSVALPAGQGYLAVQNGYVYTVNPNGGSYALQIVNATNPAVPTLAGSIAATRQLVQVAVSGNYAYVTGGGGRLTIYDISNAAVPALVSDTKTAATLSYAVAVQGNRAYITNSTAALTNLAIYDVSNPAAPALLGSVPTNSGSRSVAVAGNYAYVVAYSGNTVQAVDISNAAVPTIAGSAAVQSPYHIAISGGYAYVTSFNTASNINTLTILNLAAPAAPTVATTLTTGASPYASAISGGNAYVICNAANLIQVYDTTGLTIRGNATALNNFSVLGNLSVSGQANFGPLLSDRYIQLLGSNPGIAAVYANNKSGYALFGRSTDSIGIYGSSTNYFAITGESVFNDAGHFYSSTGNGIWAHSDTTWAGYFDGPIRCAGFTNASDARLKTDIKDLEDPLDSLRELRGVSFLYRKDGLGRNPMLGGKQLGFIAQEVETVFPELVSTDKDGYKSVNYIGVVPVLVEAVKTQQKQMDALKAKITALETQNAEMIALKKQMTALAAALLKLQDSAAGSRK